MKAIPPHSWLFLKRTVRFGDTDGAGVLHFHQLLRWSHEAWEESLDCYGLQACNIFPKCRASDEEPAVALPIIHCKADFRQPIKTGDFLNIEIVPVKLTFDSFQVQTKYALDGKEVANSLLIHLAINSVTRKRCTLPEPIEFWLESSTINLDVRSV